MQACYVQDSLNQCPLLIKILALNPMSIDSDPCRSIPIDRHWSAMICIERHFGSMPWFLSALIGINRHWALIKGVFYTLQAGPFSISSQSASWQLNVKSKCYEHNSCVRLDMTLSWGHLELGKSRHHIHNMPNMAVMVALGNMFGWDSYLDLKVICTALIEG